MTNYVYILYSGNRTYVGFSNNPTRRLRQHNGELVGGAKSTRGRNDWRFMMLLSAAHWDKRRALRIEYKCKHPNGKRRVPACFRGVYGRIAALQEIFQRVQDDDMIMYVCAEHFDTVRALNLPTNVTITQMPNNLLTIQRIENSESNSQRSVILADELCGTGG